MRKEFQAAIIMFIIALVITFFGADWYRGPSGIDGVGAALAYGIFMWLLRAILLTGAVVLIILGVARKKNWSPKRTMVIALIPVVVTGGLIFGPYIADKIQTEVYLRTHPVKDLFAASVTNVSVMDAQEEDATYLMLEYELTNIKADYFEKFGYELEEMFDPYMMGAIINQPYFVSQNGEMLEEPYFEYVKDHEDLYSNYLHTDIHSSPSDNVNILRVGESKTFCTIFRLKNTTDPIDVNFVFSNGYADGYGVVYTERIILKKP